ncbi:MAG: ATP-binding protein [Lachnospiraceae bacterium]|nr:ATP-binding protein [Lachnospiraceae bacterium]
MLKQRREDRGLGLRHSIRTRLAFIMVAISTGIIIISILANSLLLEDYYMNSKKEALSEVYAELKAVVAELDADEATDGTTEDSEDTADDSDGTEDDSDSMTDDSDGTAEDLNEGLTGSTPDGYDGNTADDSTEGLTGSTPDGFNGNTAENSTGGTADAADGSKSEDSEEETAGETAGGEADSPGTAVTVSKKDGNAQEGATQDSVTDVSDTEKQTESADSSTDVSQESADGSADSSADDETETGRQGMLSDEPFFLPDEVFSDFDEGETGSRGFVSITSSDSEALSEEQRDKLNMACETNGVTLILVNLNGERMFSYGSGELLVQRLQQMAGNGAAYEENEVIEETEDYTLHSVTDIGTGMQYLEMHGLIDGDNYFVLRIAMESIQESVSISNQFYAIVGLIMIVISCVIMWIVSRSFTEPIHRLAGIADQMAKLNFDVRYTGKQKDEVALLGNSMNEMADRLEESISKLKEANLELENDIAEKEKTDAMRQDFISNVSHELKTPIALIQGYAEGLKDAVNDDPESRDFYCDVIIDEAGKMSRMVKELLALTQIESGKSRVNIERFDITAEIDGVLQANSLNIRQNGITVYYSADEPVYVWADQYQVEEVITNYVSNAINHVNGEKVIKIQLEDRGEAIRVSVFNTGDGIPEEDIDRIWEKFYKVDKAHTREYGGNGIGLSIVKAIMESMHQDYGVQNVPGGVVFWFDVDKKN